MMKILYVSPHYDDAIISCGGKIYSDSIGNNGVSIVTIFSAVKGPFSEYAKKLHAYWNLNNPFLDRKIENINACKELKVKNIMLDFEDAIYRISNGNHLYPNDGDIFRKINSLDEELEINIINRIKELSTKETILYFPLGVGNHVDHVIAYKCGLKMKQDGYKVKFYPDFSYNGTLPKECKKMKKISLKLNEKQIDAKCKAVSKYTSQVKMLFEEESKIKYYYINGLKGKETYYE